MEKEEIQRKIQKIRYQAEGKENEMVDQFLKSLFNLMIEAKVEFSFWNRRSKEKRILKLARMLCIYDSEQFQRNDYEEELVQEVLYSEYLSTAEKYIEISLSDRAYGSAMMGMISLKDEEVRKKLEQDFYGACQLIPAQLAREQDFELLKEACTEAFLKKFPC